MKKINYKAFTLIEIIIASAILIIILTAVYSFFNSNFKIISRESKKTNIDSQAKTLIDNINQWLQMADQNTIQYNEFRNVLDNSINYKKVQFTIYQPSTTDIKIMFYPNTSSITIWNGSISNKYLDGYIDDMQVDFQSGSYINIKIIVNYKMNNIKKTYEVFHNIRND
ncbi:prepilin-type N-terminal cleavage/methylation domain-containing protein [Caldicellulosiruptoraceae bacterium PP1]